MITGFNTDIEYEGQVFHVQTEEKGRANPIIETLVYTGGEILETRRLGYAELAASDDYSEEKVMELMEGQHQALIREIRNGQFDPEGPKPFGYNIITNRSLDQVVLDFLNLEMEVGRIRLEMENQQTFVEGTRPSIQLRAIEDDSDRPVVGVPVTVRLISTREKPRELFIGATGPDGRVEAVVEIPELEGANAAVLCEAEGADTRAEIKQLIRKAEEAG
jgi:hypothetical protein